MNEKITDDVVYDAYTAAEVCHIQPQAIYMAIRKGRLQCTHNVGGRIVITGKQLREYRESRFQPGNRRVSGAQLIDLDKGILNVFYARKAICEVLPGYTTQRLYYMLRTGLLKSKKVGTAYIIMADDLAVFIEKEREWHAWAKMQVMA